MQIVDLQPDDAGMLQQVAALLVEGFREHAPEAWPTLEAALEEVHDALGPGKISRVALDEAGAVCGWIGALSGYAGRVWELHPLVVAPACQRQGIGRALVSDLERQVAARGGLTLQLGTDDVDNQTSLGGADLYPNVLEKLALIRNLRQHPYTFYQKLGFTLVGVVPDANGFGKPDILMAKRVGRVRDGND